MCLNSHSRFHLPHFVDDVAAPWTSVQAVVSIGDCAVAVAAAVVVGIVVEIAPVVVVELASQILRPAVPMPMLARVQARQHF